jgi:integrase
MATITSANDKHKMERKLAGLKDQTRANYMTLAAHFYATQLEGQPPTPKRIKDALRASSLKHRPGYWRKLRNAIMYQQIATGHHDTAALVETIYNPVTSPKTDVDHQMSDLVKGKPGTPQKRLKKLTDEDLEKIYGELIERDDGEVGAALMIAQITGCRPAEMLGIEALDDGTILVKGAKKTEKGDRGLDRYLELEPKEWMRVRAAVAILKAVEPGKAGTMRKVQDRLNTVTKAIWPRRKTRPTLYTMRYAMGSDLKGGYLDEKGKKHVMSRREVAYIMGHQSEQSADRYGNPRSRSGKKSLVKPAPGASLSGVRKGVKTPFQPTPGHRHASAPGLG